MKARQELMLDFLSTPNTTFSIPLFQRTYTWTVAQCDELWRDIFRSAKADRMHFTGVVLYEAIDDQVFSIIDGQQRLTTLMLLLSAFADYLDSHDLSIFGMDGEALRLTYLYNHGKPKLSVSHGDATAFAMALAGTIGDTTRNHYHAFENREFFAKSMAKDTFGAESFWKGLRSLVTIVAELTEGDDAQAIFESFNAKGVPLVTADLVRNYLLMAKDSREQRRLFEGYWEPIQGMFGDDPGSLKLDNAIRAWVAVRARSARAKNDSQVFFAFKCYCEDEFEGTTEDLLQELLSFSMVWAENYRYHAVKKFKTAQWASLGRKTLVSDRPVVPIDEEKRAYYTKHFGVDSSY